MDEGRYLLRLGDADDTVILRRGEVIIYASKRWRFGCHTALDDASSIHFWLQELGGLRWKISGVVDPLRQREATLMAKPLGEGSPMTGSLTYIAALRHDDCAPKAVVPGAEASTSASRSCAPTRC